MKRPSNPGRAGVWLMLAALFAGAAQAADTLGPSTGMQWTYIPADLATLCTLTLEDARAQLHLLGGRDPATVSFAAGLGAVEELVAGVTEVLSAPVTLSQLAVDKAVRDASADCNNAFSAFGVEVAADPHVYALALSAVKRARTGEERQLAKIYVENGRRAGAALDAAKRAEASRLLNEINSVQIDFNRQLAEDQSEIELSAAELAALPASLGGAVHPSAQGARIAVNESTAGPFLNNIADAGTRQRFQAAFFKRGGLQNVERLAHAIELRQRLAALLGYPDWATYQLDVKMAKTPQRAEALVLQVDEALLPKARAELQTLTDLKRASGDATPLQRWDYRFYEQQLEKTRYAVDENEVRQYFPVDKVLPAMLDLYAKLLGVRFVELPSPDAWAPKVSEYAIYDASSGAAIGWFFLDLYPREGKYEHFAAFSLRPGRLLTDGSYRKPVAAIVGNWPLPAAGRPTLLSHDELVVFFHEFGHVMHETLSQTRFASLYGPSTRLDFPEAPSQMLENWMWQPEVLKRISSRVDTGAALPDDLIRKMLALKHVDDGWKWTYQAFYADFDLKVHTAQGKVDPLALWFSLQPKMMVMQDPPGTYPPASFSHLMSGLDAGYYGYLWSRVYAQDMFSVFQKEGLLSAAAGKRYRDDILVPGGAAEPEVLLRKFLGRPVSLEPFYRDLGIAVPPARKPTS